MPHLDWPDDVRRQTCSTPCTDPTHYECPSREPGEPHHLAVRGPATGREQFCAHCGKSAMKLRLELEEASHA